MITAANSWSASRLTRGGVTTGWQVGRHRCRGFDFRPAIEAGVYPAPAGEGGALVAPERLGVGARVDLLGHRGQSITPVIWSWIS